MTALLQSPTEALTLAEQGAKGQPRRSLDFDSRFVRFSTGDEYQRIPRPAMSFLFLSSASDFAEILSYAARRMREAIAPLLRNLPPRIPSGGGLARYVVVEETVSPAHTNLTRLLAGLPVSTQSALHDSESRVEARTHLGVQAIDDLRRWLGLKIEEVAAVARLSPSTYYYWQANPDSTPRAAKVDTLFRLHALVAALVLELGVPGAGDWLRYGKPSRLQRLSDGLPTTLDAVEGEVYDFVERRASVRLADLPIGSVSDEQHEEQLRRIDEAERMGDGLSVGTPRIDVDDPTWRDG
jgi:hypothetical protein